MLRHLVKSGTTGWTQVNRYRDEINEGEGIRSVLPVPVICFVWLLFSLVKKMRVFLLAEIQKMFHLCMQEYRNNRTRCSYGKEKAPLGWYCFSFVDCINDYHVLFTIYFCTEFCFLRERGIIPGWNVYDGVPYFIDRQNMGFPTV